MDTKAFKRSLNHSAQYHRKGFGHGEAVSQTLQSEYQSPLIQEIRSQNYRLTRGNVTISLAQSFGFCWGVERAVAMAYETRTHFPKERIWITNEIIHNPSVNQRLKEMEVQFIEVEGKEKNFSGVAQGDVVILPAFGASVQEMQLLNERGCTIVDTTCPWVSKVWNTVEKHKKMEYTSIIHGKYNHEETVATSSFAGTYLIVLNLTQAEEVADYILNGGDPEAFLANYKNAHSEGGRSHRLPSQVPKRLFRGIRPRSRPPMRRHRQPNHHAQGGNRGHRQAVRAHDDAEVWARPGERTFLELQHDL
jgi:4-hydroxy-3-methylbut-2-en-1-yl diphosphate reductase